MGTQLSEISVPDDHTASIRRPHSQPWTGRLA